jgi:hypothetical protein
MTTPIERFFFIPKAILMMPKTGEVYVNYWWAHDPHLGLMFYDQGGISVSDSWSPQCNVQEHTARYLTKKKPCTEFNLEVIQVPMVFLAIVPQYLAEHRQLVREAKRK